MQASLAELDSGMPRGGQVGWDIDVHSAKGQSIVTRQMPSSPTT